MNRPGNGKIARLPRNIREELNRRLHEGAQGKSLVAWLNSLPEVREMLASEFAGKPVREQNLSDWRKRGYREWLSRQEAAEALRGVNATSAELQKDGNANDGELTDNIALWLAARYLFAVRGVEEKNGGLDWRHLREFCNDLVKLRRGDHIAARLELDSRRQLLLETFAKNRPATSLMRGLPKSQPSQNPHTP